MSGTTNSFNVGSDRDAWATVRGYAYQIDLTIVQWLDLQHDQHLELERGEDIDVVQQAVFGESHGESSRVLGQVKHRMGAITLRAPEALSAIVNFHHHRTANPGLALCFRFITNARVGIERPSPLARGAPALEAWNNLSAGRLPPADEPFVLAGIQSILLSARRPDEIDVNAWQTAQDAFRQHDVLRQLVVNLTWSTGQIAADQVGDHIQAELLRRGCASTSAIAEQQYHRLFLLVVRRLSQPEAKYLTSLEREQILGLPPASASDQKLLGNIKDGLQALQLQVAQNTEALKQHDAAIVQIQQGLVSIAERTGLGSAILALSGVLPDLSLPLGTTKTAKRAATVSRILIGMEGATWTALYGGSGMGKTELALLVARASGNCTLWLRLRDFTTEQALSALLMALQASGAPALIPDRRAWFSFAAKAIGKDRLLVLDDLPRLQAGDPLTEGLTSLVMACQEAGNSLLTTSPFSLPAAVLDCVPNKSSRAVAAPSFDLDDARELLQGYEAPGSWLVPERIEFLCALTFGHPVLFVAAVRFLQRSDWRFSNIEFRAILRREHEEEAIAATVANLNRTINTDDTRHFLYRLTLYSSPFSLSDMQALAKVSPELDQVRRHIGDLEGLWIQAEAADKYSISPLIRDLGDTELSSSVKRDVHRMIGLRTFLKPMGTHEVLLAVTHLVKGEAVDRAGGLLAWALHHADGEAASNAARPLLGIWNPGPLPPEMELSTRIYLRAMQIRTATQLKMNIGILATDLDVLVSSAAEHEAWATITAIASIRRPLAEHDFPLSNRILIAAVRQSSGGAFWPSRERIDITPARLIWHQDDCIQNISDLFAWLDALERIAEVDMPGITSATALYQSSCVTVANRIWMKEAEKLPANRVWPPVVGALEKLAARAQRINLELLWVATVHALITVQGEYLHDLPAAERLARQALDQSSDDPAVRFLINETLGRQYLYAQRFEEARQYLEQAVGGPVDSFPVYQCRAMLCLSNAWSEDNPSLAVKHARDAVEYVRRTPILPETELVLALGELSIAKWRAEGVTSAVRPLSEALERLFDHRLNKKSWRDAAVLVGRTASYLLAVARNQLPLEIAGKEVPPPKPGHFLSSDELGRRAAEYIESRDILVMVVLAQLSAEVGDDALAGYWAPRALDSARSPEHSTAEVLLSQMVIPRLVIAHEVEKAFGLAVSTGQHCQAFAAGQFQGMGGAAGGGPSMRPITAEGIPVSELTAGRQILVPLALRLAALMVADPDKAVQLAGRAVQACREMAKTLPNPSVWSLAAELLVLAFERNAPVAQITAHAGAVTGERQAIIKAAAYVLCGARDDIRLEEALVLQVLVVRFLQEQEGAASQLERLLTLPFVEGFWRRALKERRALFGTPRLVEQGMEKAVGAPIKSRLRVILELIQSGLRVKLPPWS